MNNKLFFVIDTPIMKSLRSYYSIDYLEKSFDILMVDVSPIINKRAFKTITSNLMDYGEKIKRCQNKKEFKCIFETFCDKDTIVIDSGSFDFKRRYFYKLFSKHNIKYGYCVLNSCFETRSSSEGLSRVVQYIQHFSLARIVNSIYIRLPKRLLRVRPCGFVILNSKTDISEYRKKYYCSDDTKFLFLHSLFFEDAYLIRDKKRIIDRNYCVWLDSYVPFHPDLAQIPGCVIDPTLYYEPLKSFFKLLSESLHVEVVVAAHPKSDYNLHPESYEGYKVIKGNTCLLIRDCEFVLSAASTSFLYAVMYKKPIFFLVQNELKKIGGHISFINSISEELSAPIINVDETIDVSNVSKRMSIDEQKYVEVINKYINPNIEENEVPSSYEKELVDFIKYV